MVCKIDGKVCKIDDKYTKKEVKNAKTQEFRMYTLFHYTQ